MDDNDKTTGAGPQQFAVEANDGVRLLLPTQTAANLYIDIDKLCAGHANVDAWAALTSAFIDSLGRSHNDIEAVTRDFARQLGEGAVKVRAACARRTGTPDDAS